MHCVPQLLCDQRLVRVVHYDPLGLVRFHTPFVEEALCLAAAENHLSQIHRVLEDGADGAGVPVKGLAPVVALIVIRIILVEVGLRIENSLFPQDLCHPHIADAVSEHTENVPHHIRCRWVNDQVVTVIGVFLIAERRTAAHKHSASCPGLVRGSCFGGCLPRIERVDNIGEGQHQIVQPLGGVNALRHRDEADVFLLEVVFNVHTHLCVFSAEAGQVFHNDRVYFSAFDVLQHPLELRALKVCTTPAVITVVVRDADMLFFAVLCQQRALRLDAAGFTHAAIVLTKPTVDRRFFFHSFHSFRHTQYP